MLDKIENSFKDLLSTLQSAKLYTTKHPMFAKSLDKAFASMQEVFRDRQELVIGIIGDELAFEKEVFFDLSKTIKPAIIYLKERGIERIVFLRGLDKEELFSFIEFLTLPKEEATVNPQEYLKLKGVRNISVGKIQGAASQAEGQKPLESSDIYSSSLKNISQSLTSVLDKEAIDHLNLKFSINNIMENLSGNYQEFLRLATVKRYDVATYEHMLNVSILAMYFSSKLRFNKTDIMDIGIAAMFHDIGKLYISRKILTKTNGLTDEEFSKIKNHAILGSEILLRYVDNLGILPPVVAFEHHLKYNLSGYPKSPFLKKPHIASLIVSICDVYDALSERRGYKNDYAPDLVYSIMIKEKGTTFEPMLLDKFFKFTGVWPIGSIIALDDGRVAIVRDENEEDIRLPKVEVISPEGNKEIIDLLQKKGTLGIKRFLNPWKEGKDYLHLI